MKIVLLPHAKARMSERNIPEKVIIDMVLDPDKLERDKTNSRRYVAKKLYIFLNKPYLLLVIYEKEVNNIIIITVISTSKVKKYL